MITHAGLVLTLFKLLVVALLCGFVDKYFLNTDKCPSMIRSVFWIVAGVALLAWLLHIFGLMQIPRGLNL